MKPIEEFDRVALTVDLPEFGFRAGDVGVVVDISSNGRGYTLEFFSISGKTLNVIPVKPDQVRLIEDTEIQSVRPFSLTDRAE